MFLLTIPLSLQPTPNQGDFLFIHMSETLNATSLPYVKKCYILGDIGGKCSILHKAISCPDSWCNPFAPNFLVKSWPSLVARGRVFAPSGLATQNAPAGAEGSRSSPQSLASNYFIAAL